MLNISEMVESVLESHQWSETRLAEELGVHQTTVNRMRRGVTEKIDFAVGMRLLALHQKPAAPSAA